MKISAIAERTHLSPSTIRFYINQGLIFPEKINNQYHFSEKEIQLLSLINMWKEMGFSLKEIAHLSALKQNSNWVEAEDFSYYYEIIENRKTELQSELRETKRRLNLVNNELQALHNNEFHHLQISTHKPHGLPISCLNLLTCPMCGSPLQLKGAKIDYQFVYSGTLFCTCKYQASIHHGIIRCGQFSDHMLEEPDVYLSKNKRISNELSSLMQRTSNWLFSYLNLSTNRPQVIMETRLNAYFFLYPHLKKISSGSTIILTDRFYEIVTLYKQYIERLDLDLNIIYIVNEDNHLPIKTSSVDTLIDFGSTNNYNLYESEFYLPQFSSLLNDSGRVLGAFFSLEHTSKSVSALFHMFPRCHPSNYNVSFFKRSLDGCYEITNIEDMGFVTDSGNCNMVPFFQAGEKLRIHSFILKKSKHEK